MSDELDELTNEPETEEAEAVEAEAEGTGKTGEEQEAPPASEEPEQPAHVPAAALRDERSKRQALERRLAELEAMQGAPARPDANEDPEGAASYLQQQMQGEVWKVKAGLSRSMVASQKADYAEREAEFIEMAADNPDLVRQMYNSENPALFAYETARKHKEYLELQNVDEAKAKLRAEVRAEIEAELTAKAEAERAGEGRRHAAAHTPSLSDVTTAGASHDAAPSEDLSEIALGDNL